jgi:hypothetical protein
VVAPWEDPGSAPAENVRAGGADADVDACSVPFLTDWNSDGKPDLIVGEKTTVGEGAGMPRAKTPIPAEIPIQPSGP